MKKNLFFNLSLFLALFVLTVFESGKLAAQAHAVNVEIPEGWEEAANWQQPYQERFGAGFSSTWISSQMVEGALLLTHSDSKALMLVQEGPSEEELSLQEFVESPIMGGEGTYLAPIANATVDEGGYSVSLTGTVAGRPVYAERRAVISTDGSYLVSVLVISPSWDRISAGTTQSSKMLISSAEFRVQENNLANNK